jgi:hypothetical protein
MITCALLLATGHNGMYDMVESYTSWATHITVWSYDIRGPNNQELWLVTGHDQLYDSVELTSCGTHKSVKLWGSIDQQSGTLSDHSLDIIDCMTPSSLQVMGHVIVWSYAFQSTNNQELWLVSPGHNRLYDNVKLTSHEAQNNVKLQGFSPSTTKE